MKKRKNETNSSSLKTKKQKSDIDTSENVEEFQESDTYKIDMSAWKDCFVPEAVLRALSELGFAYPTPVQALTLPSAIRDRMDILGAAETGSGKTLAFGIPLIHFITNDKIDDQNESDANPLRALVLTPTRELAIQVRNHLRAAAKYTDVTIQTVVGGMSQQKQERLLKKCPDIVVATPGRLWELIQEGNPHLSQAPDIKYLVIDEADRMIEKGHFAELLQLLELINKDKDKTRHTYIFSATLTLIHDTPKRVSLKRSRKKFKLTQDKKIEDLIEIIGIREKHKIVDLSRKLGTVETLTETRIHCRLDEKDLYLYYFLLLYPGRTLIFCNSIDCVRRLRSILALLGYDPLPLHASMHQRQRLKNLDRFAAKENSILLATDVAARGLDIVGIEHILHYQVPRTAEVYVHRSGRTARAMKEGLSIMLIEPKEMFFYRKLCTTLNRDQDLPMFPVDVTLLKPIQERIALAHRIDKIEHANRKYLAEKNWIQHAIKEMDIELDEDQIPKENKAGSLTKELNILKKQLNSLLRQSLRLQGYTGSHITKNGKLLSQNNITNWRKMKASTLL